MPGLTGEFFFREKRHSIHKNAMLNKNRIFIQTGSDPVCRTDINLLIILVIVLSCLVPANMAAADDCEVAQTWYDR
ncbi:MAG: hypothetical protein KAI90_06910, partial [Desulfobulbaceae bacterium]|nr:hypothetical protein [Desulfobulbaceae bacterium]